MWMTWEKYKGYSCVIIYFFPKRIAQIYVASRSEVNINHKHYHTFGCPLYVLNNDLQQGKPHGKWKERADVGIYIGMSPHHNKNVGLVLSQRTGLVSPQFHIKYDDNFDTVKELDTQEEWKIKGGFMIQKNITKDKSRGNLEPSVNKRKRDTVMTIPQSRPVNWKVKFRAKWRHG